MVSLLPRPPFPFSWRPVLRLLFLHLLFKCVPDPPLLSCYPIFLCDLITHDSIPICLQCLDSYIPCTNPTVDQKSLPRCPRGNSASTSQTKFIIFNLTHVLLLLMNGKCGSMEEGVVKSIGSRVMAAWVQSHIPAMMREPLFNLSRPRFPYL